MEKKGSRLISQKGNKTVLKWMVKNFKPQLLCNSDYMCLKSPIIKTDELAWRIRITSCIREFPDEFSIVLTREDYKTPEFAHYFVEHKMEIANIKWAPSEVRCCFASSGIPVRFVSLINLSDFLDEERFPPACELNVQFRLRKCSFQTSFSNYFSAVTDLIVAKRSASICYNTAYYSTALNEPAESGNHITENVGDEMVVPTSGSNNNPPFRPQSPIQLRIFHSPIVNCINSTFKSHLDAFLKCEIFLLDAKNNVVIASEVAENLLLKYQEWTVPLYVPRNFAEEIEINSSSFREVLGIIANVSFHDEQSEISCITKGYFTHRKKHSILKADLKKLFHNRDLNADFCIKAKGKPFRVHKFILAARSPVFKAILKTDMLEIRTGVMNISHMSPDAMSLFLKCVYASELEKDVAHENVLSLYKAADRYEISSLQLTCRRELMENVSITNIGDLFILSYLHGDSKLKDFIRSVLNAWGFNKREVILDGMLKLFPENRQFHIWMEEFSKN
ncbi:uncharacterized protein LOC129976179 [Argiope bruennichi]|uniref:Speckle-type POZ protein-like like protein n=1 Tax=Argiope bruennichi TaxID=94029 RepID=A0A8T0ER03_ARGBR|nr:uncharacterized protein LOC129976179 [Argiope bruennichi]KAF8778343.1 Speckle-type POZ protein-like like protein [Argiope bruennichi]